MKKQYIQPDTEIVLIQSCTLLAGSGPEDSQIVDEFYTKDSFYEETEDNTLPTYDLWED